MIKTKIKSNIIDKIEIVKPGFINFFVSKEYLQKQTGEILKKKEKFGNLKIGKKQKINVEFISANPTGPLTLGNGRGGFCGDVLSNILEKAGYNVIREYYLNDRGKQVEDLKKGLYKDEKRTVLQIQKENQAFITRKLKIKFDNWFSEKSLYKNKEVDKVLYYLRKKKLIYKKEGALWFKSTKFGDDKDRVLIKKSGDYAYLAADIAYLKNKFDRKFNKLIYFWGADHHGYIGRMKAAAKALGYKKEQVDFIIMQMVRLLEKGKQVRMSKRAGTYVALEELIDEVGLDVARFFFLIRGYGTHLNFDLTLAKERSDKNPVYYVQYAHARICSILHKAKTRPDIKSLNELKKESELDLIKQLIRFEEVIEDTSKDYQVQRIPQYAINLAESFHKFYKDCRVLTDDKKLSQARLSLILATRVVLKNTLNLMGISSPQKM
jgi:arginyl-tRNA synthetase